MKFLPKHSCVYTGWVRHRRFEPIKHRFTYPLFMLYLDLDETKDILDSRWFSAHEFFNLVSFRRKDYFQGASANNKSASCLELKEQVVKYVREDASKRGHVEPDIRRVCVLTHLRYLNLVFNPVSLYYCFDEADNLVAVLAEITNTPWDERHSYVMHVGHDDTEMRYVQKSRSTHGFKFDKAFHVSPFNPMNMRYHWNFSEPNHACAVHMDVLMESLAAGATGQAGDSATKNASPEQTKHFDATLHLKRRPLSEFGRVLIRYPFMCVSVVSGIYWQAFKLWIKKAPFYDNPRSQPEA